MWSRSNRECIRGGGCIVSGLGSSHADSACALPTRFHLHLRPYLVARP